MTAEPETTPGTLDALVCQLLRHGLLHAHLSAEVQHDIGRLTDEAHHTLTTLPGSVSADFPTISRVPATVAEALIDWSAYQASDEPPPDSSKTDWLIGLHGALIELADTLSQTRTRAAADEILAAAVVAYHQRVVDAWAIF
ncbi:hypothetical protein [Streptomyces nanshensis]|uniref:Uncharacterized protein n=1 Tax=Streptomyces nanshensis TaxID=518642 RepID=A0A1E7KZG3_9ACTN|nr:hypothetical protein [Streptomyces nanshensis]OEV09271.1 hypothetical protein AN218_22730 [Streptomyces nanshensis]